MNGIELYFIGFYKHEEVQFLRAGPFIGESDALRARAKLPLITSGTWVVCKAELPFDVVVMPEQEE